MGIKIENQIKRIIKITRSIEGWLSNQEGYFLFRLAKSLPPKAVIVEIGSWKGKSTVWLGNGINKNSGGQVYSIDPHIGSPEKKNEYGNVNTYPDFQQNIKNAGIENKVNSIRKTSEKAVKIFPFKIDLLFIDGAHDYIETNKDFTFWSEKLNHNAWVVFHDATTLPGPWKVSRNNLLLSPRFENTGMLGSMVYGQYTNPAKITHKAKNLFRNLLICLFTSIYAKMRKIRFPREFKDKIRKLNFKWRITQLKND